MADDSTGLVSVFCATCFQGGKCRSGSLTNFGAQGSCVPVYILASSAFLTTATGPDSHSDYRASFLLRDPPCDIFPEYEPKVAQPEMKHANPEGVTGFYEPCLIELRGDMKES